MPLFDDADLTKMTIALLTKEPCPAHGRVGHNVCSVCCQVSCVGCLMPACNCSIGGDEEEMEAGGIFFED